MALITSTDTSVFPVPVYHCYDVKKYHNLYVLDKNILGSWIIYSIFEAKSIHVKLF